MFNRSFSLHLTLAAVILTGSQKAGAADHLDAPALAGRGDVDINDIYAFQSPATPANSVLILTVNPLAGVLSDTTFNPNVEYEFLIDNDGDAMADVRYTTTFSTPLGDVQTLTTARSDASSSNAAYATGQTGVDLPTSSAGGKIHAGVFDDPFFFDLNGFQNGLAFTGDDFFAGANVSAIVLEVPSSELGGGNVGVWARTVEGGSQVDRKGRPAINTVLIPSARKDEFNQGAPADDPANFASDVQAAIESLNGGDASHAAAVTGVLLPDVLTFDTGDSSGFLNGRQLADDVIDAELTLLTNSSTPIGDGVDANDVPFRDVFPYLGEAQVIIPEPTTAGLLALAIPGLIAHRRRRRPCTR